ncbi:MAG: hypothetical protein PUH35_03420 [Bacteroidales bacterium]|nr:hypothetical protein [Bacteroidales bacterium]MDY2702159.1 hypothetical protein [Candidatus Cryptobacteroides sp.]
MNECMLGGAMQGFFSVADEGCPFDALCRVSFRGTMKSVLLEADVGSPPGDRCRMSVRGPLPSLFMKFTWHAKPHYRYL